MAVRAFRGILVVPGSVGPITPDLLDRSTAHLAQASAVDEGRPPSAERPGLPGRGVLRTRHGGRAGTGPAPSGIVGIQGWGVGRAGPARSHAGCPAVGHGAIHRITDPEVAPPAGP
ncbi:hypothetical protein UK12_17670 [Saccharothrix sp. ST-888]|nr:hypothetical protein UK12_17670 [Saccharothrix sp. ST-888]